MARYRVSVCRGPDCRENGAEQVYAAAQACAQRLGLGARCELARGGCYGLCHLGANVVVREVSGLKADPFQSEDYQLTYEPGETYYWAMTPAKVERVLQEHVAKGTVVADLVGDATQEEDFRKRTPGP